jgi:hypothetical protein
MIDSYSFGNIVVDGERYTTDVIIFPDRVEASWWRKEGHNLCLEDLRDVLRHRPEILVVGQGKPGLMKVGSEVTEHLQKQGIELISQPTAKAVATYNKLCTKKQVVAALHLTC